MEEKVADSFSRIMQGLKEAVEHAREADVPGLVFHVRAPETTLARVAGEGGERSEPGEGERAGRAE